MEFILISHVNPQIIRRNNLLEKNYYFNYTGGFLYLFTVMQNASSDYDDEGYHLQPSAGNYEQQPFVAAAKTKLASDDVNFEDEAAEGRWWRARMIRLVCCPMNLWCSTIRAKRGIPCVCTYAIDGTRSCLLLL